MATNTVTLDNFPNFCNFTYYQQKIPTNQSSISNFTDVTNNNNIKMIDLMDNLKNIPMSKSNQLIKHLFNLKLNFKNQSYINELNNCKKIKKIIDHVNNKKLLIEKISALNKLCLSIFFNYDVCDNPNDGKPYIISIETCKLPFPKNYYFDSRYTKEIIGYNDYCFKVLLHLSQQYHSIFGYFDIYRIHYNVIKFIKFMSPYVMSSVKTRDLDERINQFKLSNIADFLPNINFLDKSFLEEFRLKSKINENILFPNKLTSIKTNINFNVSNKYCNFTTEQINDYDNGDYYWATVDYLFRNYDCDNNSEIQSMIDDYILWTIIESKYSYICETTRKMKFDFFSGFLMGQLEEKPIKERSINSLSEILPELIGKLYCDHYFTPDHKNQMNLLIDYLLDSYKNNFNDHCKWIDEYSLTEAINKIDTLKINKKIGYPEEFSYSEDYDILFELLNSYDTINFTLFDYSLVFCKWNVLLDILKYYNDKKNMTKWEMSAIKTNAYYHPLRNEIVFPAGILQEPFFIYINDQHINTSILIDENSILYADRIRISKLHPKYNSVKYITMASNFGSIGAVIGHEISHGFDDNGSKFDANGKLKTWWTEKVKNAYEVLTNKIVNQYNNYTVKVIDQIFNINGKLTLGENISDLFGLRVAIDAYKHFYQKYPNNKTLNEGLMELFISFGNTWRYIELPEKTKNRISVDVHAPPHIRIMGTLKNIREFYEVFEIPMETDIIEIFG
jgi:predicted metalloendopeptidase